MVNPEKKIYTINSIQTKHVIFKTIYLYTYMHVTTMDKEYVILKDKEGFMGGLGGRKGKGSGGNAVIIL